MRIFLLIALLFLKPPHIIETTGGTFDIDVKIIITTDTAFARKYVARYYSSVTTEDFLSRGTTFKTIDGNPVIIWLPDLSDQSIIAHECFHAARSILSWADISLSDSTEEIYAYEEQYLFAQTQR